MKPAILLLVLAVCFTARAEEKIYRWTEADGSVHYSNEPQQVPQAQGAETTTGEEIGILPTEPKQPEAKPSKEQLEERKLNAEVRRAEAEAVRSEVEAQAIRERSEADWRLAFRAAREKISRLEAELEEERALLEINGMPVIGRNVIVVRPITPTGVLIDDRYERAKVRVPQLERAIVEARNELDDLERRASFASVPRNVRQ